MVRSSDKCHLLHLPRATGLCGRIPLAIPSCGGGAAMQERADSTELGRPTLLHPALRRLAQVLRCGPLLSPLPASNLFFDFPSVQSSSLCRIQFSILCLLSQSDRIYCVQHTEHARVRITRKKK
jgi:hypothetical protein